MGWTSGGGLEPAEGEHLAMVDHRVPIHALVHRAAAALVVWALVAACAGCAGSAAPSAGAPSAVRDERGHGSTIRRPERGAERRPVCRHRPDAGPVGRGDGRPGPDGRVRDRAGLGPGRHVHDGHGQGRDREAGGGPPPDWVASEFPSEGPEHKVTLSKGFWIDGNEVSNKDFAAFRAAGGYTNQALWSDDGWTWLGGRDAARLPLHCNGDVPDQPRTCITWYEAEAYAAWRAGRLPTEAEWEYAARGPKSTVYPWGDTFDRERANVLNSVSPKPVGSYPTGASWVGALDMSGNAMEWVADWLDTGYYTTSPATDPTGPATGEVKVEKGGWWGSNEFVARSAYRHYEDPPTYGDKHIGFRVASQ